MDDSVLWHAIVGGVLSTTETAALQELLAAGVGAGQGDDRRAEADRARATWLHANTSPSRSLEPLLMDSSPWAGVAATWISSRIGRALTCMLYSA